MLMAEVSISFTDLLTEELNKLSLAKDSSKSLLAASARSTAAIDRARSALAQVPEMAGCGDDLVAFGSLARHELTPSSDLDYLFIGMQEEDSKRHQMVVIDRLRETLVDGVVLSAPGSSGIFGSCIDASKLTEHVGLEDDTNHNLTRRILFLEESVSLFDPAVHEETIKTILSMYLEARKSPSEKIPRFLLNDIIRYWRTIAVDYHAKQSRGNISGVPYSLRYLKLLISRKLCFISSIAPLYLLSYEGNPDELEFLLRAFKEPAVLRLIRLLNYVDMDADGGREKVQRIVETLDYFIERSGDQAWRKSVEIECKEPDPKESANFGDMRKRGKQLHQDISDVLTSKNMIHFTKEYMLS